MDPITGKYPELTPYQFASNRPIDGIDLDGLEYVKHDSKATSLIIYNNNRDGAMEAEYQAALKSNMNVMIANDVNEANGYLITKGTKYQRIISFGHGGSSGNQVVVAGAAYSLNDVHIHEKSFKVFSGFLEDKGMIFRLVGNITFCRHTPELAHAAAWSHDLRQKLFFHLLLICDVSKFPLLEIFVQFWFHLNVGINRICNDISVIINVSGHIRNCYW